MSPQRRTALVSVAAALVLVGLKLSTGIATHSLGLISEALHSGTDLIAALLTFFALGIAGRPADRGHQYGHGKAEHLAALAEAAILVAATVLIGWRAVARLAGSDETQVDPAWYALVVVGVVMAIDLARVAASARAARRYRSPALQSNALHFASDFAGSGAVLVGLLVARAGYHDADAIAALFVSVLVLSAATRLIRRNVDVLMDRAPADAYETARQAIAERVPGVSLLRLRMRQAAGRHFADVVIGVSPGAAVGQGHAVADMVEQAIHRALPESDVVVHVEPEEAGALLRERAQEAALRIPRVREIHNVSVVEVDGRVHVSLHLKLPGELTLDEAHEAASQVEDAILQALPEVAEVQTHLEPLAEAAEARRPGEAEVQEGAEAVLRIVEQMTGSPPREMRFLATDEGLVAFLTLGLDPSSPLQDAHATASAVEERIRVARPEIADVIVHTEP